MEALLLIFTEGPKHQSAHEYQRHRYMLQVQHVGHQQPLSGGWRPGQMLRAPLTSLNICVSQGLQVLAHLRGLHLKPDPA